MRFFRGSCGLTPRRRCQPGSGATRLGPVFPTKREGPARGCRRHAVAVEALVPPGAARVAIRVATRVATVYTNAPIRRGEARSSHLCTLLRPHRRSHDPRDATVYTNAPKRHREAILADLCTLLRPHGCPQQRNSPTVYTNAPKWHRGAILANLCTLLRCRPRVPLAATEWQADRALDATAWHENRHMRSCQEMLCHPTPASGTSIVHSTPPSGTAEPRQAGARATPRRDAWAGGRGRAGRLPTSRRHDGHGPSCACAMRPLRRSPAGPTCPGGT